jgi:6-pyruvoyltetrahydropterin/6-carboxytetrahydropterin synthase
MNISDLKDIIREKVVERLDHRNINTEVGFMKGKVATTENLAIAIWDELKPAIEEAGAELHSIKIQETENNTIEYYG